MSRIRTTKRTRSSARRASTAGPKAKRAYAITHWGNLSKASPNMKVPDFRGAELYELGRLVEIVYLTAKGTPKKFEFEHETKTRPRLLVDANDPHSFFIEWTKGMQMTARGIVG